MKKGMACTVLIIFFFTFLYLQQAAAASPGDMGYYCITPPFVTGTAPPLVMFLMSKDQQLYFKAYTDTVDLDDPPDGIPDVTYKDGIRYYGYFDPDKCYGYSSGNPGRFNPLGRVDGYVPYPGPSKNHYCTGPSTDLGWSGNFLNWATMSRIDIIRRVIYGGQRYLEDNNNTVLSRALIPNDAHAWAKVYTGSDLTGLTPSDGTAAQSALTLCNADVKGDKAGRMIAIWGDRTRGAASPDNPDGRYYPDSTSVDGPQCYYTYNGSGTPLPAGKSYDITVAVCPFGSDTSLLEDNCMAYGNEANPSYRPAGLMQKYGINRHQSVDPEQWTNQMYFGLITGSYEGNKSGGVIRSNITDVNSEIGSTDGKKNSSSKLIKTIDNLAIDGYNWPSNLGTRGNWTGGQSNAWNYCGLAATINKGQCVDWGNPVGEMYYEALRYFMGVETGSGIGSDTPNPTEDFALGDTGFNDLPNQSSPDHWTNPYATYGACYKPFILIMSDIYPSYDSDQLPGAKWSPGLVNDTGYPELDDVKSLLGDSYSHFNTLELADRAVTSVFAGEAGGAATGECTAKATSDAADVRGLCPEEPSKEGSFYLPGLAWWAHVKGFDNPAGKHHTLSTYSVATPTTMPAIKYRLGDSIVQMLPAFKDLNNSSKGQLANFKILTHPGGSGGPCTAGSADCVPCDPFDSDCNAQLALGYQYGYEVMYDDSIAGNDYDLDVKYRIYVKPDPVAGTITIKTKGVYASAGHSDTAGYIISGVSSAGSDASGQYLEIECGGSANKLHPSDGDNTDCDRYCNNDYDGMTHICDGTDSSDRYEWNVGSGGVKACSKSGWINCSTSSDCPAGETCNGLCSIHTSRTCSVDKDCPGAANGETCSGSMQTMLDSEVVRTFQVTGSHTDFLENPLYYASKYGGFLVDGDPYPDTPVKWQDPTRADDYGKPLPLTYFFASNPTRLEGQLENALNSILTRASSGTAASVLASGEGSGANLVQAIFYPQRPFWGDQKLLWSGSLQNFWYYIDPNSGNSTIRENTADSIDATSAELNLDLDDIVNFRFDANTQEVMADLYKNVDSATPSATVKARDAKNLWEAGIQLWARDVTEGGSGERKIYTLADAAARNADGSVDMTASANRFETSNVEKLEPFLNTDVDGGGSGPGSINQVLAANIIRYVEGTGDGSGGDLPRYIYTIGGKTFSEMYRSRSVSIDANNDGDIDAGETNVWKLGDIVNSTPRIVSWIKLNNYDDAYGDSTYSAYLGSNAYRDRGRVIDGTAYGYGVVFAGANDGMLHAFKLGALEMVNDGTKIKAKLYEGDTGGVPGTEEWAFIPRNVLPYLKYLKDPGYCHIYSVDLTPYIFDASIGTPAGCTTDYWDCDKPGDGSSWRTVLIGGMKLGGGCSNSCPSSNTDPNCVQTPVADGGFSSYFALDVTDPMRPELLWEFTDPALGFSTSGPAIIRISARVPDSGNPAKSHPDNSKNGKWFVLFGSGPTGYTDPATHQFMGHSDQNLSLFVLDLKNGTLLRRIKMDGTGGAPDIAGAFSGSLNNANMDYDMDYQDDALYAGYTREEGNNLKSDQWTGGGILRLVTKTKLNGDAGTGATALNPQNWEVSLVMDGIGPVTASVAHLAHYPLNNAVPDEGYLFFGTGRYFFKTSASVDDATASYPAEPVRVSDSMPARRLFGIKEPCLSNMLADSPPTPMCDSAMTTDIDSLTDASSDKVGGTTADAELPSFPGWYIDLDGTSGTAYDERLITDPIASPTGEVFFITLAPSTDICTFGGSSYLWAVKYDTAASVAGELKGKGLLQVSTGAIEQIDLGKDLVYRLAHETTGGSKQGGRRTAAINGVPPTGLGFAVVVPPKPTNRMQHIRRQ